MLIKSKSILTMIAVAGISVMAGQSQAASITFGDLIFGFRVATGTGVGTDVLIRANPSGVTGGNGVTYRDATGALTVANISGELAQYFGSATRSDITWTVVGVRSAATGNGSAGNGNVPADSPFVGYSQGTGGTAGVQNSVAPDLSASAGLRNSAANAVNAINALFQGTAADAFGTAESIALANTTLGGWTEQIDTNAFFQFGANGEGAIGNGLDLYWVLNTNTGALDNGAAVTSTPGVGVYQGSFAFNSGTGNITFTPAVAAIPEPSRALLAGLGLGGLLMRRRRAAIKTA